MNLPPWAWLLIIAVVIGGVYILFFSSSATSSKELGEYYHEYKIEPHTDLSEVKLSLKKINDKLIALEQASISNSNKIRALQLGQGIRQEQMGYISGTTNALTQAFLDQGP